MSFNHVLIVDILNQFDESIDGHLDITWFEMYDMGILL